MPIQIGVQVVGLDSVLARLEGVRQRVPKRLVRKGVRELAARILAEAYRRCPVDTGELRRSGRIVNSGLGAQVAAVEFTADHAAPVEYGHRTRSGSFVVARPFLGPAAAKYSGARGLNIVAREIRAGLRG